MPVDVDQDVIGSEFSMDQSVFRARAHPIGEILQTVARCGAGRRDAAVAPRSLLKVSQGAVEDMPLKGDLGHGAALLRHVDRAVVLALVPVHHVKHLGEIVQGFHSARGIGFEKCFERAAGNVLDYGDVRRIAAPVSSAKSTRGTRTPRLSKLRCAARNGTRPEAGANGSAGLTSRAPGQKFSASAHCRASGLKIIRVQVGHECDSSTAIYTHVSDAFMNSALRAALAPAFDTGRATG
jgi:hypothetical protein